MRPDGEAPVAARSLRDRILVALLADRSVVLVERDDAVARLRLTTGEQVVLITCPAGTPPAALRPVLDSEIKRAAGDVVHIVAVGGDRRIGRELKRSAPFWQFRTRFGFHHVADDGAVRRVTGPRFRRLGDAVDAARSAPEPDEAVFAPYLARGQEVHAHENRLDAALRGRFPWLTLALGAACVLLFVLGQIWSAGNFTLVLYRMGANSGADVRAGEVWRVVASMFLHADVGHIAVNMVALAAFGPVLERLLGPQRYLLLYGLSGLGAGLASAFLYGAGISVGASGAIWGLMTAGVALALSPRGLLPPLRLERVRRRAIAPLAINLIYSFSPGVDMWAHFGGGIVGAVLMATGLITRGVDPLWTEGAEDLAMRRRRRSSANLTLAAIVVGIVLASSVALALITGQPWRIAAAPVLERVRVADTGVVLLLPDVIARSPVTQDKGEVRIFSYGDMSRAPVGVEIIVSVLPQVVPVDQLDEVLEHERQAMQDTSLPDAKRLSDAKIVTVGPQRGVVVDHTIKGLGLRTWLLVLRDREVLLRVYSAPDRPAAWLGIEDRIAESLQVP